MLTILPVIAALVALTMACGAPPPAAPRPDADIGTLHPPSDIPGAFLDRQSISASYGSKSVRFDAVLQKRDDEIVLLGMTPFGSRAFLLKQKGMDVSFESFVPQEMPFPPRYILFDVQRVFFSSLSPDGGSPPDGTRETPRDAELMTEVWKGGRLQQRRFRRASGDPKGEIVIDYQGGMVPGEAPAPRISFVNGWYGYRLDIATVSHQPL